MNEQKMAAIFKMSGIHFMYAITVFLFCYEARFVITQSGRVPEDEMSALVEIAQQLGKKDWDFTLNPCDGNSNWATPRTNYMPSWYNNTVICDCSYPESLCHVRSIFLTGQDLSGVVPPSLAKLRYLKNIDLTRNYLSGNIPPEWASTKLEYISVMVNRLSGPIPKYLGNITTLVFMNIGSNLFNGTVPAELGNLINLEYLILNANYLTGELPLQLNNLKKLRQLGLSSNNFAGKIPSFRSWTSLEKLELQASGFGGPLPSSISILTNLTELRISDLNGGVISDIPLLTDMKNMTRLMLRSCNISGTIPQYLSTMPDLQILDLSFNKFEGEITNLDGLTRLLAVILTNNSLTGPIPEWTHRRDTRYILDLSYNNFEESSVPSTCSETLNLFRSYRIGSTLKLDRCVDRCSKDYYSFHVNCGGRDIKIGNTHFEGDEDSSGPNIKNWGTSRTGLFWSLNSAITTAYVAHNVSLLRMNDSELYMTARLSALSLTYYGRCLGNGNYTVTLYFAEIIFRNNQSFQSLGRRIFDVYIQGKKMLEDFNIEQEAKGVDTPVKMIFKVMVTDKTLEIRFRHTGKGTAAIPFQGQYGPLISAISVESDFMPPNPSKGIKKILIKAGASLMGLCLVLGVICFYWRRRFIVSGIFSWKRILKHRKHDAIGPELQVAAFTLKQIRAATNNFDTTNKIGEGGFGPVYKGLLPDGTVIAVKQLSSKSKQGNREFLNEIGMISCLQHPNLMKLYGCCAEGDQLLVIYKYMENNSLAHALFGSNESQLVLDWPTRFQICIGIARGLAFLHEESRLKIVHRDIKATNVLLDKDLNPKISDFGLARLYEDEKTHISTKVAGTIGYMAPEYALWGYLTDKVDVYSFGVLVLELVSGKRNHDYIPNDNFICLLDWACHLQGTSNFDELVDERLGSCVDKEEIDRTVKVAVLCTNATPSARPTMSEVVKMLEGTMSVPDYIPEGSTYTSDMRLKAMKDFHHEKNQITT